MRDIREQEKHVVLLSNIYKLRTMIPYHNKKYNLKWVSYTVVRCLVGTEFLALAKILRSQNNFEPTYLLSPWPPDTKKCFSAALLEGF